MKVIIVSGPTASGKTDLSIALAIKYGGEIVNFDSLLLYQELNIGTAKPTPEERSFVPHHMIDVRSIRNPMNAADYARTAIEEINRIHERGLVVYLVGGSGFYLQAVLKGMYDSPTTPNEIREKSNHLYSQAGIAPFIEILKDCDPLSFKRYHENDHYRVRRAVEHWWAHGTALSSEREKKDEENKEIPESIHNWEILHIHLDLPKEEHLKIIERRTDKMICEGLQSEVEKLLESGFSGLEKPLQSIGYKEMLDLRFGVYKSIRECRDRILISTWQLAKSQRTWFKKDQTRIVFHPLEQRDLVFARVKEFLK